MSTLRNIVAEPCSHGSRVQMAEGREWCYLCGAAFYAGEWTLPLRAAAEPEAKPVCELCGGEGHGCACHMADDGAPAGCGDVDRLALLGGDYDNKAVPDDYQKCPCCGNVEPIV